MEVQTSRNGPWPLVVEVGTEREEVEGENSREEEGSQYWCLRSPFIVVRGSRWPYFFRTTILTLCPICPNDQGT